MNQPKHVNKEVVDGKIAPECKPLSGRILFWEKLGFENLELPSVVRVLCCD